MYTHTFSTMQKLRKLQEISGYILIEVLAAVAMAGLSIAAITRLEYRGKTHEKEINKIFRDELNNDPVLDGTCSEEQKAGNLRLISCVKGKRIKYYISGFSTLELAISLAVVMPCILSLAALINISAGSLKIAKSEKTRVYNTVRINQLLNEIIREIDAHPFQILPKVHFTGQVRYSDGKLNPVVSLQGSNKPDNNSDAISYLRLNVPDSLEILTSNAQIFACPRYKQKTDYKRYQTYLLLGPEGFFEGSVKWLEESLANGKTCTTGSFEAAQSIFGKAPNLFRIEYGRYLIPIERMYTLYIDKKKILRYLGHRGAINIENQPVIEKSPALKIKADLLSSGLLSIKANLNFEKQTQVLRLSNKLARAGHLNYLLNRP